MKLYAIHATVGAGGEDVRAARTGFSVAALIFGPLWLLFRGLWLPLAGYALGAGLVVALTFAGVLRPGAAATLFALGQLYLGVEGRAVAVAARTRAGWPLVDVIHAHSALEAEHNHLERTLDPAAPRRAAPSSGPDVIGLFPEPGR